MTKPASVTIRACTVQCPYALHATIGAKAYAQWTGPMRRHADLDVHRALDRLVDGRVPAGRTQQIDHEPRQTQLERANQQALNPRMDFTTRRAARRARPSGRRRPGARVEVQVSERHFRPWREHHPPVGGSTAAQVSTPTRAPSPGS